MQKEMQGKVAKHLLHAVSALNAKEESPLFGEEGTTINEIEISLQLNEYGSDVRKKIQQTLTKKRASNIENRFKSFIRSKGAVHFSKEFTIVTHWPTKYNSYQLSIPSIVGINVDLESGMPNKEIASSIHAFFTHELADMLYMLGHIVCLTCNGVRYIPEYHIFENETFPPYVRDGRGYKRLLVYVIRRIDVGLRPGTLVESQGNFLKVKNTRSNIVNRGLQYIQKYFNPGIQFHWDLKIETARLHAEEHNLVEIDITILPVLKYRGELEHEILKRLAFDMQAIVKANLTAEIQNDDLEFIVRFNGKKFVITDGSDRRKNHLRMAQQWPNNTAPVFRSDAFRDNPSILRERE